MSFLSDTGIQNNYYQILSVSPDYTHEQIVQAYMEAKAIYAPNNKNLYSVFTSHEILELIQMTDEAFYILSDRESRDQYDKIIYSNEELEEIKLRRDLGLNRLSIKAAALNNLTSPGEVLQQVDATTVSPKHSNSELQLESTPSDNEHSQRELFEQKIAKQEIYDGTFLRKVRLHRNISLDELELETKISPNYLMAIESNDYEVLPAPVFVRGYLKHIAQILSLQPEKVARSYMSLFK